MDAYDTPRPEITWLRPDPIRRLAVRWWFAGVAFVGGALLARWGDGRMGGAPAHGVLWVAAGALLVLVGVLYVFATALRALADETCLAIRRDGVLYRRGSGPDRLVPWSRLGPAEIVPLVGEVVAADEAGEPLRIRTAELGTTPVAVARLLNDARRRALLGLPLDP